MKTLKSMCLIALLLSGFSIHALIEWELDQNQPLNEAKLDTIEWIDWSPLKEQRKALFRELTAQVESHAALSQIRFSLMHEINDVQAAQANH